MKKLSILLITLFLWLTTYSQQYEIKVKVEGVDNTPVYLGHYLGEKAIIIDVANTDSTGYVVFRKDETLGKGMYLIMFPTLGMNYFEFLIADSQNISLDTKFPDFEYMKIEGSEENRKFYEYKMKNKEFADSYIILQKELQMASSMDEHKNVRTKMDSLDNLREEYMESIISEIPESFLAKVLNILIDIKVPEYDENGERMNLSDLYMYYKDHYFDNVDFSEGGLVRTPVYESKLNNYINHMVMALPDSMIKETRQIIQYAYDGGDTLMFRYTSDHLLNIFDTSTAEGYDAVYAAIAEDWYLSGKATWADSISLFFISMKVGSISPLYIGKTAPDLNDMESTNNSSLSLSNIDAAYTVLVFYEPSYENCKDKIAELMELYRKELKKYDVKIFAVYTLYDKKNWLDFLQENNLYEEGWYNIWDGPLPHSGFKNNYNINELSVCFLLNREKKIIGKNIINEDIINIIRSDIDKQNKKTEKDE
ncbi:MAG: DUF5106 domain-containing protein [Bacteroidales bacterium]|jgi:hypothetical protein|nr:DUF5106 domain-containing protein [Bacteroidales bacterium]